MGIFDNSAFAKLKRLVTKVTVKQMCAETALTPEKCRCSRGQNSSRGGEDTAFPHLGAKLDFKPTLLRGIYHPLCRQQTAALRNPDIQHVGRMHIRYTVNRLQRRYRFIKRNHRQPFSSESGKAFKVIGRQRLLNRYDSEPGKLPNELRSGLAAPCTVRVDPQFDIVAKDTPRPLNGDGRIMFIDLYFHVTETDCFRTKQQGSACSIIKERNNHAVLQRTGGNFQADNVRYIQVPAFPETIQERQFQSAPCRRIFFPFGQAVQTGKIRNSVTG